MPGTDRAYGATGGAVMRHALRRTRAGRAYAMSGTGIGYAATQCPYAMSGTAASYQYAMSGTDVRYAAFRSRKLRRVWLASPQC
eukprot:3324503-Rhodomonas_salina.3